MLKMGMSSTVKRVRDSLLSKERSREDLKIGIAGFYDRSSKLWEDVWGEVIIRTALSLPLPCVSNYSYSLHQPAK
jgi:hypothetical protein